MLARCFVTIALLVGLLGPLSAEAGKGKPGPKAGDAETFLRQQLLAGKDVDFRPLCGDFAPKAIGDVAKAKACRTLGGAALARLLTDKTIAAASPAHGFIIDGLFVEDAVDLGSTDISANIVCRNCLFAGRIDLAGAILEHGLHFEGSELLAGLDAAAAQIKGRLSFVGGTVVRGGKVDLTSTTLSDALETDGARFDGESLLDASTAKMAQVALKNTVFEAGIQADDATIGGTFTLTRDSKVGGKGLVAKGMTIGAFLKIDDASDLEQIDLSTAHLDGGLAIEHGAHIGSRGIDLADASIGGQLEIDDASVDGLFCADGAVIAKGLHSHATTYADALSLNRVSVGGDVEIDGGSATRLAAQKLHVGGSFYLRQAKVGAIDMKGALVGADAEFIDADVGGDLELNLASIGKQLDLEKGTRVEGAARFTGAAIAGDLLIGNAPDRSLAPVRLANADFGLIRVASNIFVHNAIFGKKPVLVGADIAGHLDIAGATLPGLDMTRASVRGDFRLAASEEPHEVTAWSPKADLELKNAHVGVIQDESGRAEKNPWPTRLDLQGFSYDHFANDPPIDWARGWLDSGPFGPEPFFRLAKYYADEGHKELSDQILYEAKQKETVAAWVSCVQPDLGACAHAIGLSALWALIGYGIGNGLFQALIWVLLLTIVGALVLRWTRDETRQWVRWGGPGKGRLWCVGASVNQLIPLVELNKEFKDFFEDPGRVRLRSWQLIYFAAHAVMGYVLASFVVAAIAGLTQSH